MTSKFNCQWEFLPPQQSSIYIRQLETLRQERADLYTAALETETEQQTACDSKQSSPGIFFWLTDTISKLVRLVVVQLQQMKKITMQLHKNN